MELDAALRYVCKHWPYKQTSNPFFFYSVLSDLCHTDYEEMQSISCLYEFDRRYFILKKLLKYGNDGIEAAIKVFSASDKKVTLNGVCMVVSVADFTYIVSLLAEVIGVKK